MAITERLLSNSHFFIRICNYLIIAKISTKNPMCTENDNVRLVSPSLGGI